MREFLIVLIVIFAFIGLCGVSGIATGVNDSLSAEDDSKLFLVRGFAVVTMIFTVLGFIGGIIYLIIE